MILQDDVFIYKKKKKRGPQTITQHGLQLNKPPPKKKKKKGGDLKNTRSELV